MKQLLVRARSSLWFVPAVVVLANLALAIGLVELDRNMGEVLRARWPRLFATEAEGARNMLSAIASSMATIAGVVFSITMVALALASNQYTSRVMRNFMRDRSNQVVLGIFIGVHLYCLVVLRSVGGPKGVFVPSSAVLAAVVLAVLASGAFIYFVHHISVTIQASEMARAITHETLLSIDRMFADQARAPGRCPPAPGSDGLTWHAVPSQRWGYVQTIAHESLLAFAREHDAVVRMECGAGDFIGKGRPLVSVAMSRAPAARMVGALNRAYGIDAFRTIDEDPGFGIRQLVDMSLKALSPGINDTTTAVTCIEHLGMILECCARRDLAVRHHHDGAVLRVIAKGPAFGDLSHLAFSQIIENAGGNTEVLLLLLATMGKIAVPAAGPEVRRALGAQLDVIEEVARASAKSRAASTEIGAGLAAARTLLATGVRPAPEHGACDPSA